MPNKNLITILIGILLILIIFNKYNFKNKDTFYAGAISNPKDIFDNDGKMLFKYLNEPNYSEKILKKYYLNDDKLINGVKVNPHIYQNSVVNCNSSIDTRPYVYSADTSLHCRRHIGWWNKYDTISQDIYNNFGVRR